MNPDLEFSWCEVAQELSDEAIDLELDAEVRAADEATARRRKQRQLESADAAAELDVSGFVVGQRVLARRLGPTGSLEWFVAVIDKLRPKWPPVSVTFISNGAGETGRLSLPSPPSAYMFHRDLRPLLPGGEAVPAMRRSAGREGEASSIECCARAGRGSEGRQGRGNEGFVCVGLQLKGVSSSHPLG